MKFPVNTAPLDALRFFRITGCSFAADMRSGCTFNRHYVKSNPHEVENATWMLAAQSWLNLSCTHLDSVFARFSIVLVNISVSISKLFYSEWTPVYMAFLRFMGDEMEARNFSYNLEVGARKWSETHLGGTPRRIRSSRRKVGDSHDGLIIQRNMALFFSGTPASPDHSGNQDALSVGFEQKIQEIRAMARHA